MNRADAVVTRLPQERASSLRDLWQLLRPTQWSKNGVLFAALLFSKHLFNRADVVLVCLGFTAFCMVASAAYVMNDLRDCDRDRQHPLKSLRPLPAGRVRRGTAAALGASLLTTGLCIALALGIGFGILVALYFVLQVAYTFWQYGRIRSGDSSLLWQTPFTRIGVVLNGSTRGNSGYYVAHDYALHQFQKEADVAVDAASGEGTHQFRAVLTSEE